MNLDQVGGVVRALLATFSGYAMAHGFTDATWAAFTGGVLALLTVVWSWKVHKEPVMEVRG